MRAHDAPECRVTESIEPSDIGSAFRRPDRRCKMHSQSIHIAAHSRPTSAVHWRARRGWMNAIRLGADLSTLAMAYGAARLEPDEMVESLFERSSLGADAIALVRFRFARLTSTIAVPTFRTWKRNERRRSAMSVAEAACATGRVVLIVSPDAVILQPRLRNATRILRSMRPPGLDDAEVVREHILASGGEATLASCETALGCTSSRGRLFGLIVGGAVGIDLTLPLDGESVLRSRPAGWLPDWDVLGWPAVRSK